MVYIDNDRVDDVVTSKPKHHSPTTIPNDVTSDVPYDTSRRIGKVHPYSIEWEETVGYIPTRNSKENEIDQ